MRRRRRGKAAALGLALLICLSNLTAGAGEQSAILRLSAADNRTETEAALQISASSEDEKAESEVYLAGGMAETEMKADTGAKNSASVPEQDSSGPISDHHTDPVTDLSNEGAEGGTEQVQDMASQTKEMVLAGPVELNPDAGSTETKNDPSSSFAQGENSEAATESAAVSGNGTGTAAPGDISAGTEANTGNVTESADGTSDGTGTAVYGGSDAGSSNGSSAEGSGNNTKTEFAQSKTNPETEDQEHPENESVDMETEYLYEESMSIRELTLLPRDEAGAATEISRSLKAAAGDVLLAASSEAEDLWSCSNYYVNEEDLYSVTRNQDFSLKYQVEFHTSTQLEPGSVQIRIPESLMNDRQGNRIIPSQIGVPEGTEENCRESLNSPFNWYRDDAAGELVFFNYRRITSGTNTVFQVLYHPVRVLEISDQAGWSLTPAISVTTSGLGLQQKTLQTLTGSIDSYARIVSIQANAYSDGSLSCMPALYTKEQVKRLLGADLPDYLSDEEKWLYVAWQADCQGDFNQPWNLCMNAELSADPTDGDGDLCVAGSITKVTGIAEGDAGRGSVVKQYIPAQKGNCLAELTSSDLSGYLKQGAFHLTTIAVTAIRKDVLRNNQSILTMNPEAVLTPADGIDPSESRKANASWTFVDYTWKYQGDVVGVGAWTGERLSDGSVTYGYHDQSFSGWINEFRVLKNLSDGSGPVPFKIRSECRGYACTHHTEGALAGDYITGTGYEVTTADDVLYAISPEDGNNAVRILTKDDYYYSSVSVSITDRGMDIYEDSKAGPMDEEECPGADRSTRIYAMFEGSTQWEMVTECPWAISGEITYTFTDAQMARKPYRVKVVHNAVDYESSCDINTQVCIRKDSPVISDYLSGSGEGSTIRLEHLGAVLARSTGTANDSWFHDRSVSGNENYSEPGLADLTRSLYGEISMRANSFATLSEFKKHARALKTVSRENDPASGCVRLEYTIGALEGYRIYSREAADSIRRSEADFPVPDRGEYVIYDLLPEGVIPDPSQPMKAGLVMGTMDKHLVTPTLWNQKNVRVRIDPDTGVISNWKNTGRTMLILNVSIDMEPEQISRMSEGMWMNGIGVRFCAYCPYKDLKRMNNQSNIAALMPGTERENPLRQILGSDGEVACDDGVIVPYSDEVKAEFQDFGADIDSDGITDLRTVLYAFVPSEGDVALSLTDGISLTVKADKDEFSTAGVSAVVGEADPYTYRIDVTNSSLQPISELVIADHLEIGDKERTLAESTRQFDSEVWQGILLDVDVEAAKRLGISPVIYLSEDRNAPLPGEGMTPESILTPQNGWHRPDEEDIDMSRMCSVAVDLRRKSDGSSFVLNQGESVHLSLSMQAPMIGDKEGETRAQHAYNCASFYSISADEPDADLVVGDAVEVTLMKKTALIVEKKIRGEVPEGREKESYLFCLTRNGAPVSMHAYRLEKKRTDSSGNDSWEEDGELHTTNRRGQFYLRQNERAVFAQEAGGDDLEAEEIRSAGFESAMTQENKEQGRVLCFENSWKPTVYLTKKVYGTPEEQDLSGDVFRVKVTAGGKSLAGTSCWTVDPEGEFVENQVLEEHIIDEESCIILHEGEVIAFHPGEEGCLVEAAEMDSCFGPDSDYVAVTADLKKVLLEERTDMVLENAWKWKDLILQKKVLHRERIPESDIFSFRLWKMHDNTEPALFDRENPLSTADPVAGVKGSMEEQEFVTDENGCFSLACAGKDVSLRHLEAGKSYVIEETSMPEFYEPVNGGLVSVVMPVLAEKRYAVITNSWRKRSLEVSKAVLAGKHVRRSTVCTPGFPGYVQPDNGTVLLMDYSPAGMESFTIEFPVNVRLSGNGSIQIITENGIAEHLTGTIEAGTVKTYSAARAQVKLQNVGQTEQEGFFFHIIPYISGQDQTGEDLSGRTFTFCLETEGEDGQLHTAAATPYIRSDGTILSTDENGMFTLSSGTSAMFTDLGLEGTAWQVTESQDAGCPQVYPDQQKPWSGRLGENGTEISHALFINGEECQGMIRKSFCAPASDTDAQQWIASERSKGALSMLRSVFRIEAEEENGAYVPLSGEICVADSSAGCLYTCEISGGMLSLSESESAIISGLAPGRGWRVTEEAAGVRKEGNILYGFECISPGDGRMVSGSAGDTLTCADFVNEVHSIPVDPDKLISKAFLSEKGWNRVPEGATLAFRLEKYEGGSWINASNVRWVQCLREIPQTDSFHMTGEDGIIRVSKEKEGSRGASLGVYILPVAIEGGRVHNELYYTQYEAANGDMRIREALDLSDSSFGMPVNCEGLKFINENSTKSLIVEKQTDISTSQRFTIQITQQFQEGAVPGRYLSFQIKDASSGEIKGSGRTDDTGCFTIRSGEQAVFELAAGSKWTVTEKTCGNWKLSSCSMKNQTSNPEKESRGVTFELLFIEPDITLTSDMLKEQLKDPSTGQIIDFNLPSITIPHYIQMGDKIMEITGIEDYAFYNYPVQSLNISEGIRKIGNYVFYNCTDLTKITLPRSLEEIGTACFGYSKISTLEFGPNVHTAGLEIARKCDFLERVIIHQNRKNSPFKDYNWIIDEAPNVEFIE